MSILQEFIQNYGATILYTVITAIAGYIGVVVKNLYVKYITDKTKKDVVKTCVRAVNQIYKDLHGDEKLNKCIESVIAMLSEKGVTITDIEIRMLIEAAVNEFNDTLSGVIGTANPETAVCDKDE